MDNVKILKNTINDNNFFRYENSELNDNKRLYDLDLFYQKKYSNTNNKNDYNIKNKNYSILENNNANFQNEENNLENRNYYNINENMKLDPIFAYDIEAENNIGKYKQKIINRSNIVEQNYKKFNEYQNSKFNRINLRYTQDIKDEKYPYNNINIPFKSNDYYKKGNTPNPSINYLDNMNQNQNKIITSKIGNRMYKSHSSGNIFQNKYYLSNFEQSKSPFNIPSKDYLGKRKTDITDNELINMRGNNDNGFYDYCNKKVQFLLDNQKMVEDKINQEKRNKYNSRLEEQNEIKIKNKFYNNLNTQNKLDLKNSKIQYKNLLDEQVKNNINNKLLNENLTLGDVVLNKFYLSEKSKSNVPNTNFLNKNRFVEINPYNHRNYFLGNSSLRNNIITNPQVQYKTNRYLFPQIPSNK